MYDIRQINTVILEVLMLGFGLGSRLESAFTSRGGFPLQASCSAPSFPTPRPCRRCPHHPPLRKVMEATSGYGVSCTSRATSPIRIEIEAPSPGWIVVLTPRPYVRAEMKRENEIANDGMHHTI